MDIRSMHGFSIIEVAAALAITGIAAAIAIPNWNRLIPVYQLDSSTRQLQSELHTIKSRAVSENASFQLQYTAGAAHYSIQRDATVVNTKPLPDGVVIIKTGSVSFSPRGTAGSNRIRLRNLQGTCGQLVVSATGRVRVCKPVSCAVDC